MLADADRYLIALRQQGDTDAEGLVVCADCDHAAAIVEHMTARITGRRPVVACSRLHDQNDPAEANGIQLFRGSHESWIVAVNMVSKQVDIPRLRGVVYLTSRLALLAFRQIVSRWCGTIRLTPMTTGASISWPVLHPPRPARASTERGYALMTSTATIDPAAESFEAELDALLELVAAELNLRRLTAQVMRITRQVNALERVVIPRLVAEHRPIAATLEQRALEDRARVARRAGRHPRSQWFPRRAGPPDERGRRA
jgi:hypothetical protein